MNFKIKKSWQQMWQHFDEKLKKNLGNKFKNSGVKQPYKCKKKCCLDVDYCWQQLPTVAIYDGNSCLDVGNSSLGIWQLLATVGNCSPHQGNTFFCICSQAVPPLKGGGNPPFVAKFHHSRKLMF